MEVPIQKAAMELGILPSVLIRRIKQGELKGRKQGGIWYLELPEKEEELALAKREPRELAKQELPSRELVETLRKQLESQATQITTKDRQIQELHFLLQQSFRNRRNPFWPFGS